MKNGFKIRLRVRIGKTLNSNAASISLSCEGRTVELKSEYRDKALRDTNWVIFIAKGFETEDQARSFGERFRVQIMLAALSARVGVDTGSDQVTSWINENWARSMGLIEKDQRMLPNIHGLMVIPDRETYRFPLLEAEAQVNASPDQLTKAITELSSTGLSDLGDCMVGVRLLNLALMNAEPLAQAVLAFAAVEELGQDEKWSERQKNRLEHLAIEIKNEAEEEDSELLEISDSLRRSLHRIGLRQGVMRTLDRLSLSEMKREWDRLYGIRSGIFHGTKILSENEIVKFAHETITLCTKIVIANARSVDIPIPSIFETRFD